MAEQQEASGTGSSVDPSDKSTGDPKTPSLDPQVESDSPTLQCPHCGGPIRQDPPVDAGEEMLVEDQDQYLTQTLNSSPSLSQMEAVLKELKDVMLIQQFENAERLVKNYIDKTPPDKHSLFELLRYLRTLHQKPDKGRKTTSSTSSSWNLSRVKFFSVVTGRTCGADDVIMEQVKKVGWFSTNVEPATDPQDCDIIILFCPITSRVGTDVDAAMKKISGDKPVVLVVMHHTRDADYSVDKKRWSDTFKNVVLDVHVLFHETLQGLLKCSRNNNAVHQIQKELKRHSKYRFT
ncbi:uncharacterized protein LOC132987208 [Labrus mixtus]|uniref:uncharacterized protein LOC132987208 n=1 Tax=Labrus mixtus TaxID=508554 RepID=UPI0029C0D007|nr:uncharacterized protein LOC132987208 [Labrus mixtus]